MFETTHNESSNLNKLFTLEIESPEIDRFSTDEDLVDWDSKVEICFIQRFEEEDEFIFDSVYLSDKGFAFKYNNEGQWFKSKTLFENKETLIEAIKKELIKTSGWQI